MFFLRKGAGEPLVTYADLLAGFIEDGVAVASDAAVDHFQANQLAFAGRRRP